MADHVRYLSGSQGKLTRPKIVEFRHLTLVAGQQVILEDITLDIFEGECVAVLGKPASGKSTLLACVQGAIQPTQGEILLSGVSLPPCPPALLRQIGIMPQYLDSRRSETVAEYLLRFAAYRELQINKEQLHQYCAHYDLLPSLPVAELTHLQRRIFALALTLMHDPSLVLLDEPLRELAEQDYVAFWPYLQRTQREGRTLLCTFPPSLARNYLNEYDLVVKIEQGHLLGFER